MGQLEKYGLYVLCLVIFLILGVALWGEPAEAGSRSAGQQARLDRDDGAAQGSRPSYDLTDFKELMSPAPPPDGGRSRREQRAEPPAHRGNGGPQAGDPGAGDPGAGAQEDTEPAPRTQPVREQPLVGSRPVYKVAAGDTLGSIAMDQLGSSRLWPMLAELNPKVEPQRLQPGQSLVLPTRAEVEAGRSTGQETPAAAAADAPQTHRIARGDTLEGLARRYFGNIRRVKDIVDLNPTVDPTRLRIGQLIRLPAR